MNNQFNFGDIIIPMHNKFSIGDMVKHPNNGSYHIVIKDTLTNTELSYYTLLNCQNNTETTLYHYDIIKFVMVSRA